MIRSSDAPALEPWLEEASRSGIAELHTFAAGIKRDQVAVLGRGQLVALGGPEELRRQAFGGEIVEVVGDGLERSIVDSLGTLDGVEAIHRLSFEQLRLTVDEASIAIPRVLETLKARGVDVRQVQEYRPNFDEVFVQLMEQSGVESVE